MEGVTSNEWTGDDVQYMTYRIFFLAVFCALTGTVGCGEKPPPVVVFYCSETFWPAMREASYTFQRDYRVRVVLLPIHPPDALPKPSDEAAEPAPPAPMVSTARPSPAPWRHRPQSNKFVIPEEIRLDRDIDRLITSFDDGQPGSMYLTDSTLEQDELNKSAQILREYPFCQLTLVLLLPKAGKDTVLGVNSVKDLLEQQLQLGITDPAKDGMGLEALKVVSNYATFVSDDRLRESIRVYDRQVALLDGLKNGEVDGILVWDSYLPQTEDFAQAVELTTPEEQVNILQSLCSLRAAENDKISQRFADFLLSAQGLRILRKHGFVPLAR